MKKTNYNVTFCFRAVSLTILLAMCLHLLVACQENKKGMPTEINTDFDVVDESSEGYIPVLSTTRLVQMGKDYIFFAGKNRGIFKYDIITGEVSDYCTDPICRHVGKDASCRLSYHRSMQYFRAFSEMLVYVASYSNSDRKMTHYVLAYDPNTMKNVELDDNASTSNWYCVSNKYIYFTNTVVRDSVIYYNHKQVSISDGRETVFGEEKEGAPPYTLLGAINGYLFAQSSEDGKTYICKEDTPGEFTLFWENGISNIWAGKNDIFFRSSDPDSNDGKYCFYQVDLEGNVLKKQEIIGDMRWCSFYDGKNLYYIPAEETEFVNIEDDTTTKIHCRELYCLDMETGERTVAFRFDGDYATMALQFSMGNDIIVRDGKIYTYKITEQSGYWDENNEKWISGGKQLSFNNGIAIIDMQSGDITHITADYSTMGEISTNSDFYEMDLEREK